MVGMCSLSKETTVLFGMTKGKRTLWKPGVDGTVILKLILEKDGVTIGTGFVRLRMWSGGGLL